MLRLNALNQMISHADLYFNCMTQIGDPSLMSQLIRIPTRVSNWSFFPYGYSWEYLGLVWWKPDIISAWNDLGAKPKEMGGSVRLGEGRLYETISHTMEEPRRTMCQGNYNIYATKNLCSESNRYHILLTAHWDWSTWSWRFDNHTLIINAQKTSKLLFQLNLVLFSTENNLNIICPKRFRHKS